MSIELKPIGFVRTDVQELPRHWSVSDVEGTLVIGEEYSEGLRDIRAGQHPPPRRFLLAGQNLLKRSRRAFKPQKRVRRPPPYPKGMQSL
jgi:hypothetical protein